MPKRRHGSKPHASSQRRAHAPPAPPPSTLGRVGGWIATAALVAVLLGSSLLVDPTAYASFDAPKRLIALCGTALAAFAVFGIGPLRTGGPRWSDVSPAARIALLATVAALVWACLSAALSPDRAIALDSLRTILGFCLLLPLGASAVVARRRNFLLATVLAAAAVNTALSLLQARGTSLFRLQTYGTRNETGALAGNVGYLALSLAFAGVLALGVLLASRRAGVRIVAAVALLLSLAGLFVNRNLTSWIALVIGGSILLVMSFGRRSVIPVVAVVVAFALASLLVAPLRQRVGETVQMVRRGDWDRLTTYRTGAWAAALEMTRERPVVGFGPGTYAAEFTPHRLKAEIRTRRRYVNPLLTSSYSEAHCDYLQAFAETGVPGGLTALVAVGALFAAIGRRATRPGPSRKEATILVALLAAGAAAALTWFPLQRPISAVPLLLAAGRSWRLASERAEETSRP
jgi:O-antigen ligase